MSSAAPPASNIYDELEELHSKAELGVISESAVHEELEVLHSMHGRILHARKIIRRSRFSAAS